MKKSLVFNFPKKTYFPQDTSKTQNSVFGYKWSDTRDSSDVVLKSTTFGITTAFVTSSTRLSISMSNWLKYLALNQMPIAILALMTTNWI